MIAAIRERELPAEVLTMLDTPDTEHLAGYCADFKGGADGYSVLMARERIGSHDWRWHISVAHTRWLPKWGDMVEIAHRLRPGVVFVLGVPPRSWWLNVHEHCLHLWELHDENLISQWRAERQGHTPS